MPTTPELMFLAIEAVLVTILFIYVVYRDLNGKD